MEIELKDPWGLSSIELLEAKARQGNFRPELRVEVPGEPAEVIRYEIDHKGETYLSLAGGISDEDLLKGLALVCDQLQKNAESNSFPIKANKEARSALERLGLGAGEPAAVRKSGSTQVLFVYNCNDSFRQTLKSTIEKRF